MKKQTETLKDKILAKITAGKKLAKNHIAKLTANKKLTGGILAGVLVVAIIFGSTTSFFGALDLDFDEVDMEIQFTGMNSEQTALFATVCAEVSETYGQASVLSTDSPAKTGGAENNMAIDNSIDLERETVDSTPESDISKEVPVAEEEAATPEDRVDAPDMGEENDDQNDKLDGIDLGTEEETVAPTDKSDAMDIGSDTPEIDTAGEVKIPEEAIEITGTIEAVLQFTVGSEKHEQNIELELGRCEVFTSTNLEDWDTEFSSGVTYKATASVKYEKQEKASKDFNFTLPGEETTPTETENNDFITKPTFILLRIGDIDGPDANEVQSQYEGFITANDANSLKVEFITKVLFEDNENIEELITEVEDGIQWTNDIYKHWDGIIFRVYPLVMETAEEQSFQIKVTGYLDEEITSEEDLIAYEIGDGTDNVVELSILGEPGDAADEDSIGNMMDLAAVLNKALLGLEDTADEETASAADKLVEAVLNVDLIESDESTEGVIDFIKGANIGEENETGAFFDNLTKGVQVATEETKGREITFSDVSDNDWFSNPVLSLAADGVLSGYDDGTFHPEYEITRAELTKLAVAAFQLPIINQDAGFTDVDQSIWYAKYINTAAYYGFINGYDDGTFKPGNTINRAETAKVLIGMAETMMVDPEYFLGNVASWSNPFIDVFPTSWYYEYFMQGYTARAITGSEVDGDLYGYPLESTTRGAAAKMVHTLREILATPTI